jgi:hypothetical protein
LKIDIANATSTEKSRVEAILSELPLTGDEEKDRLIIQSAIDEHDIRAGILYNGNRVWGKNRIISEYKKLKRSGQLAGMSNHFYAYLHLACGSIAHYSKDGWIRAYENSVERLEDFFRCNEFGRNIFDHAGRFSDRKVIAKELLELTESK